LSLSWLVFLQGRTAQPDNDDVALDSRAERERRPEQLYADPIGWVLSKKAGANIEKMESRIVKQPSFRRCSDSGVLSEKTGLPTAGQGILRCFSFV